METFSSATVAAVLVVLCCCYGCPSFAEQRPSLQQATAGDQAIDPSLDILADRVKDEDREKRQLSFVQNKLLNFLKPLPVVDVTKEEDKYGNDGDKFNRFGRGVVGGVESLSSRLTSALSFPVDTAKKLSRSATEMLNNLGGRLIGLQR